MEARSNGVYSREERFSTQASEHSYLEIRTRALTYI
jgi:hypothetical protein